jgi:PAS domain S-box-containing protein/diguanylate cyclase (GGDEF)-like protein
MRKDIEGVITGDVLADVRLALNQALDRESRLATVIRSLPEAIYVTSVEGTIQTWNPAAQELFGYRLDEIQGLHVSILGPTGSGRQVRSLLARVIAGSLVEPFETTHVTSSGQHVATRDSVAPIQDVAGNVVGVIWSSRNIDEQKRLEAIVWEEKERTEAAFELVADAVLITDAEGRIAYLNPAATHLTGWSIAEAHGRPVDEVAPLEHEESREPVSSPVRTVLRTNRSVETGFHNVVLSRNGTVVPVEDAAAPFVKRDGTLAGAVLTLRPVGRKAPSQAFTNYLAVEDPATGQLGRRELEHRLEQALLTASRDRAAHTLLTLKVQRFDEFSSSHGPAAGAELLRQIAVMLRTQIREMDSLARLQRGEYAVLLSHCPLEQGHRIALQTRRVLRNFPFYWDDETHEIAVQFGVIPVTPDSGSVSRILQIADVACQMADTDGIDLVHVLDVGDINRAMSSRRWDRTRQVTRAFNEGRFRLYGQRIRPLVESGAYGEQVEMLVHMLDDIGDVVTPAVFLPAAERLNLLVPLDRWVVKQVFRMVTSGPRPDIASWTINLSEATLLDPDFPAFVHQQFRFTDAPAQSICFEIAESTAMHHVGATRDLIEGLRPLGYAFSLSGFGGSPNSFAYLRNLRVDYLKIDGSLVRNINDDPVDRAIIDGIVNVAKVMGIRTIAGMVEDETTLDMLRVLGVDYVQGYAIAEPLPLPLSRE